MRSTDQGRSSVLWLAFLLLALLGGLPLVFLTPPFQVPDEPQHFFRAFQLSEGGLTGINDGGASGAALPSSLPAFTERMLGTRELHTERPVIQQNFRATLVELGTGLQPDVREFVDFRGAAAYSPLAYLPQVAGILTMRFLDAGPLGLLWGSRLANLVVATALLALAIKIMPLGRGLMMLSALLPMSLFQIASASPDAMVIACAFLFTALTITGLVRGGWSAAEVVGCALAGLVFCSVKPTYAPILLLPLVLVLQHGKIRHAITVQSVVLFSALGGTLLWLSVVAPILAAPWPNTDPAAQLRWMATHPTEFVGTLLTTLVVLAPFYIKSAIGILGWLSVPLPPIAYLLPILGLALSPLTPHQGIRLAPAAAWWAVALTIASALLVFTALYLNWNPVGHPVIEGVQGRYFIPLFPLLGAVFSTVVRPEASAWRPSVVLTAYAAILVPLAVVAPATVIRAYGLF